MSPTPPNFKTPVRADRAAIFRARTRLRPSITAPEAIVVFAGVSAIASWSFLNAVSQEWLIANA